MSLFSLKVIKNLLKKYRIFPSKRLGQNFLINKSVLLKIIKTADLKPKDIVLEIGPGLGVLTQELLKKVKRVIAVEKDKRMAEVLKEILKNHKNLEIIQGDILKIKKLKIINYKIVANLPYYIVSPVIRKFLEEKNQPKLMVLMVQKEVAQRICTKPPDMNLLAISVQFYAKPEIVSFVSKNSFWPQPKVDSAIIKIIPKKRLAINKDLFFRAVKAGFFQPRKQLVNNLSKMLKLNKEKIRTWLLRNSINPSRRAETLSLDDWIALIKDFPFLSL